MRAKEKQLADLSRKCEALQAQAQKRSARGQQVFQQFMDREARPRHSAGGRPSKDTPILDLIQYFQLQLEERDARVTNLDEEARGLRRSLRHASQSAPSASAPPPPARHVDLHEPWAKLLRTKNAELDAERQGLAQLQQTQLHSTAQVADLQACNARLTQQLRVCPSCPSPALDPSSAPLPPAAP